ncbi:MAG: PIN domain-containing protein [Thiohalorhabdaceae bacterium]
MIVLDTNVISELMRPAPNTEVVAWVDEWPAEELGVTAITIAEVLYGIARLDDGQRKETLWALAQTMFKTEFGERVLPFAAEEAEVYAELVIRRQGQGLPISIADAQIAAIAVRRGAVLATRNSGDFAGLPLEVVNPWEASD